MQKAISLRSASGSCTDCISPGRSRHCRPCHSCCLNVPPSTQLSRCPLLLQLYAGCWVRDYDLVTDADSVQQQDLSYLGPAASKSLRQSRFAYAELALDWPLQLLSVSTRQAPAQPGSVAAYISKLATPPQAAVSGVPYRGILLYSTN